MSSDVKKRLTVELMKMKKTKLAGNGGERFIMAFQGVFLDDEKVANDEK